MINPKIITLNSGFKIALDFVDHVNSATCSIWTNVGSKCETPQNNGLSHFFEHMVFKGTSNYNAYEISEKIESKGGYLNAWTSKEKTTFYAKVLKDDVILAMDILFDMLQNSIFDKEELEKERGVIIEEIKMYLDNPNDLTYNLYEKLCYGDHPLGMPIIGNEGNIKSFSPNDFFNHLKNHYHPSNMILVVSGNFNENEVLTKAQELSNNFKTQNVTTMGNNNITPVFNCKNETITKKDVEQTNLIYGVNGYSYTHNDYYKMSITNAILGGGMSSRLFREIREKRGLAYSIDSFLNSYGNCGTFAVQVGCSKTNVNLVLDLIKEEITKAKNTITQDELQKAKNQLKSSILMSLESTYSRCERIANSLLNFNEMRNLDELIAKIEKTTIEDVVDILNILDKPENSTTAILMPQ